MAVTTVINKNSTDYTVYSSAAIVLNTQLYSDVTLTTAYTTAGEYLIVDGTKNYITVNSSGVVTRMLYAYQLWNGQGIESDWANYTIGPLAVGKIFYDDVLYYPDPLVPSTINGVTGTTNLGSEDGLTFVEMQADTAEIVKIRTAPFLFFRRFEPTVSTVQSDRNTKLGYVYYAYYSTGFGGVPPFTMKTGANVIYNNIISGAGEIKFDDFRKNSTRNFDYYDTANHHWIDYNPTMEFIADPSFYTYTFDNVGMINITYINPNTYDNNVTIQYQLIDMITSAIERPWSTNPTIINAPIKDYFLEIKDEYGSYLKIPITYTQTSNLYVVEDVPTLTLSNDPMVVISDSTLKYGSTMKYKYTMYNNLGEVIMTSSVYPDINNNLNGIYNMNMIYNNYTSASPFFFDIATNVVNDNIYKYTYNVNDNVTTTGLTSEQKYVMKGASQYGQFFDYTDYLFYSNNLQDPNPGLYFAGKFLTDWEGDYLYNLTDYASINYLYGEFGLPSSKWAASFWQVMYVKYNHGDPKDNFQPNETIDIRNANKFVFVDLDVSSSFINNLCFTAGFGPMNFKKSLDLNNVYNYTRNIVTNNFMEDPNIEYYDVFFGSIQEDFYPTLEYFINGSNKIRVYINKECSGLGSTSFMWLDQLSNYNTFSFNNINIKEYDIERSSVYNDYRSVIQNKWTYNVGTRGEKTLNVRKKENHVAESGWLDDTLSKNLMNLYSSSDVYVIIDGKIYPIIITTSSVEEKNIKNNRLFNHKISYRMAYDLNINV